MMDFYPNIGAVYLGEGRCRFRVWGPLKDRVEIRLLSPREKLVGMDRDSRGYWCAEVADVRPGALYFVRVDGGAERPDPASFDQPEGVHGPSRVLDPDFGWRDGNWAGLPLRDHIFYELHVGAFTPEGTFDAVIPRLGELADLGVTSVELMPVAQFPGERNWGYDGVNPFAAQNSYGGPDGLRRLVDACHRAGLAVTLDVVYNHLGPEGNYLREFGPYFTGKYITPWGEAINFDDAYSEGARNLFIQNALFWIHLCHVDALRLDAVHAIYDRSAVPFLAELAEEVESCGRRYGRRAHLIAESDLNDSRLCRPKKSWGYGLDAQWADDFHHALHALLTGEREGYYADFGKVADLATAFREGFVYSGRYSEYRKRRHGNRSDDLPSEKFVIASQNHDQIGNRMLGERLSALVSFEALKVAAAAVLLSPFLPLLFMGEEYGEDAPFPYFVSHSDPELVEAVRRGRRAEFGDFSWKGEPPDPSGPDTFLASRLNWRLRGEGRHRLLLDFHRELIRMRKEMPALSDTDRNRMEVAAREAEKTLLLARKAGSRPVACLFNFGSEDREFDLNHGMGSGWCKILDSADKVWGGPGSTAPPVVEAKGVIELRGHSVAVYEKN